MLEHIIHQIAPLHDQAMQEAMRRQTRLTKPLGALGRLETLSVHLAAITGSARPRFGKRTIVVAAASHGVAEEGVSAYPASVTAQMVANFFAGGAAINVLAENAGAHLVVVDAGIAEDIASHPRLHSAKLAPGTRNILHEPAMPAEHARIIVEAGIMFAEELIADGTTLMALGEMGIGNTTAAAAITAAALQVDVEAVTGRGTLIDDVQLRRKQDVITSAVARHRPSPHDGLALLHALGGYEIGFLAGCSLACAVHRIPVVLDGYITAAAALIATRLAPTVGDYLIASHASTEPGHRIALNHLGLEPLFDLGLRLGEGSGAALTLPLVVGAARLLDEMATFDEAGVDGRTHE